MRLQVIVAGVMIAAGLVWIGQGLGVIRGSSFMTDDARWAIVGTVLVVVGAIIVVTEVRRRRRS